MARIFAVPQRKHSRSCWKISSGERNNEWSQNNGTCPGRTVQATNNDITAFQLGAMPSRSCSLTFTKKPQFTSIIAQKELINGWQETEARYKNNQNYTVDGNKSNCSLKRNETWRSLAHSNPYSQPCVRKTVCASFVSQTAETALTRIGWENNKGIK